MSAKIFSESMMIAFKDSEGVAVKYIPSSAWYLASLTVWLPTTV